MRSLGISLELEQIIVLGSGTVEDKQVWSVLWKTVEYILGSKLENLVLDFFGSKGTVTQAEEVRCKPCDMGSNGPIQMSDLMIALCSFCLAKNCPALKYLRSHGSTTQSGSCILAASVNALNIETRSKDINAFAIV